MGWGGFVYVDLFDGVSIFVMVVITRVWCGLFCGLLWVGDLMSCLVGFIVLGGCLWVLCWFGECVVVWLVDGWCILFLLFLYNVLFVVCCWFWCLSEFFWLV